MKTIAIIGLGLALFVAEISAQDLAHGAVDYKLCASCHGFKAQGNELVNAPALAGLEDWYLTRQIQNFRSGLRGAAPGDIHGNAMAIMTRGIQSDTEIADVVAYIGSLPIARPASTMSGDIENGREQYAPCSACHGVKAEGNMTLNAPVLTVLDGWYQLRQLNSFKSGKRGLHPQDIYGQQMQAMVGVLADQKDMHDVVAYIETLR